MSGDWIKMRKNLPGDPRLVRMASALHADRLRTLGACLSVWCLFDDHSADGSLPGYTPAVLDEMLGFPGLTEAMARVGWIRITNEGLEAVNFTEHNGHSAKRRAQETVRKQSARCPQSMRTERGQKADQRREEKSIEGTRSTRAGVESGELVDVDEEPEPPGVPTRAMFSKYCLRHLVPEWFADMAFDTWSVKAWRTGKTPVAWKAVVRLYVARDYAAAGRPATAEDFQQQQPSKTNHTHENRNGTHAGDAAARRAGERAREYPEPAVPLPRLV